MPFFSLGKFLNIYSNMNKHLRVTSASRVSSQCVTLGSRKIDYVLYNIFDQKLDSRLE
ncbi:hypothetical protein [Wolbachia endosymbiont (group A) of Anthophora plumipes]|uniref:hypothetical protein n=1 Tax=Wolbachia endosymbiont (group A) of Anthophora plumipes TaxID=3066194 RepID=UPI0033410740